MIKISEILDFLTYKHITYSFTGDTERTFEKFCPLNTLMPNAITWVRYAEDLEIDVMNRVSGLILIAELGACINGAIFPVIYVDNVHRTFFQIVQSFFKELDPEIRTPGVSSSAIIETDRIGDNLYVGHHTYIGPDVTIGNHVTILHNVTIQGKVTIGDDTTIESGTTIGVCGFGHYWDENSNPIAVPHFGGVTIGSHVKIGANSAISRGCLANTVIEDYVKIDNLCHVAHNDHIKRGAMLTANSVVSGSTTVGENVWMAPGSLLNNAIEVGENAFLGIGAVAIKDVPAGKVMVGMPARALRDRRMDE